MVKIVDQEIKDRKYNEKLINYIDINEDFFPVVIKDGVTEQDIIDYYQGKGYKVTSIESVRCKDDNGHTGYYKIYGTR